MYVIWGGLLIALSTTWRPSAHAYEFERAENSRVSDVSSCTSSEVQLFAGADARRVDFAYPTRHPLVIPRYAFKDDRRTLHLFRVKANTYRDDAIFLVSVPG